MKNCAVVCEYNPFHTGHEYQLGKIREKGADNIFCVMSGNFVQSALPAFCDKALRARCAVSGGADAVIELPAVFATASAQFFARGAVKIISQVGNLTHMAMGAVGDPNVVLRLADIRISHRSELDSEVRAALKSGKSYNKSNTEALCKLYEKLYGGANIDVDTALCDPNNILCIEYISAIADIAPSIEPILIPRIGATHNDSNSCDGYISATAIRAAEQSGNFGSVKSFIPFLYDEISAYRTEHAPDMSAFKKAAVFALKTAETEYIKNLRNCSEGLEYLLKDAAICSDYDGIIESASGTRYSKKRIARLMFDILLGIRKEYLEYKFFTRLLACKKDFDFSLLPSSVKTDNAAIKTAANENAEAAELLKIDEKATALYYSICGLRGGYYNYSLIKV